MKKAAGQILLPIAAIVCGILLVLAGNRTGQGLVWISAGIFFIVIGISAGLLTLAQVVPGTIGIILRSPVIGGLILAVVLLLLVVTVLLGLVAT